MASALDGPVWEVDGLTPDEVAALWTVVRERVLDHHAPIALVGAARRLRLTVQSCASQGYPMPDTSLDAIHAATPSPADRPVSLSDLVAVAKVVVQADGAHAKGDAVYRLDQILKGAR